MRLCRIHKQRELIALHRQGTRQQRPQWPTVTPPGMRVNTEYINSTKGKSSEKDGPSGMWHINLPFRTQARARAHARARTHTHTHTHTHTVQHIIRQSLQREGENNLRKQKARLAVKLPLLWGSVLSITNLLDGNLHCRYPASDGNSPCRYRFYIFLKKSVPLGVVSLVPLPACFSNSAMTRAVNEGGGGEKTYK